MKYCSQCEGQVPDEARFCNKCGTNLNEESEVAAASTEKEILATSSAAVQPEEEGPGTVPEQPTQSNVPPIPAKPQGKIFTGIGKRAVITGIIVALLLAIGGFWGWRSLGSEARVQQKLDLAVKYISENKFEEAILAYNEAIEIEPKEVKAYQGLAKTYTLQGKYDDAKATYDKGLAAVGQDKKKTLQMGLAGMYIDQGQLVSAEKAFQEIKNSNKACLEVYWGLAMVYQKQGDNAKAEAMLRQAAQQNPNEYRTCNTLALFLKQNNKGDEAFNNLVKSLALEINQQEAYIVLSDLYKGRWAQLQAKLAAVSNQQVAAMLEFYSYYTAADYQQALTIYNNKLVQQTDNQKARVLAAIAMAKTGNNTGAESLVSQLSKEKLNEWLLSDLAYYYQAAGDKEKAREYAVKALQANGTNLEAIALLQNLNNEDASIRIYTTQALLYNWKPVCKVKQELQARNILNVEIMALLDKNDQQFGDDVQKKPGNGAETNTIDDATSNSSTVEESQVPKASYNPNDVVESTKTREQKAWEILYSYDPSLRELVQQGRQSVGNGKSYYTYHIDVTERPKENGFLFHVYQIVEYVDHPDAGHAATTGWYMVKPDSGEIWDDILGKRLR